MFLIENDKIIDIKQNIDQVDEIIDIAGKLLTQDLSISMYI